MRGFRKESLLVTTSGVLALEEIGDINGQATQSINYNVVNDTNTQQATEFLVGNPRTMVRITTGTGMEIDAHPLHEFKVFQGNGINWVAARDLTTSMVLPYRVGGYNNTEKYQELTNSVGGGFTGPPILNEDVGWFLGVYLANGTDIANGSGIQIDGRLVDISRAMHMIDTVFNIIDSRLSVDPPDDENPVPFKFRQGTAQVISTELSTWLGDLGLTRGSNNNVRIPHQIRRSPISVIRNFLEGFNSYNFWH